MRSSSDTATSANGDHDETYRRRLLTKLDRHILPIIMILYLFNFLTRINIASARVYGMDEDLQLDDHKFKIANAVLYATYILFKLPSSLSLKKLHPQRFLPAITVGWGILATLEGIVQSFGGLITIRLLLGALQSGLYPCLTVYLTFFYTKKEIAFRKGFLFVSSAFAGALGGVIAFLIQYLDGAAGLRGWRWIFIIEGILTVVSGVIAFFVICDEPATAKYLTDDEKEYVHHRIIDEDDLTPEGLVLHWKDVWACFTDWKCNAFAIAQLGVDIMLYGFSTNLGAIIQATNPSYSHPIAQVLTIPCYCLGAITYLIVSGFSDRVQKRGLFVVISIMISALGYVILLVSAPSAVQYFGCFIIATGMYVAVGLPLTWLSANCPRYGKRVAASGYQLTIGNLGGLIMAFLYSASDAPRYVMGNSVTLAMVSFSGVIFTVLMLQFTQLNKVRGRGEHDYRAMSKSADEVREMGDEAPTFKYSS